MVANSGRAASISKRAAKVGFDWQDTGQIFEKIEEEITELHEAVDTKQSKDIGEEIGDLLFAVVNLARRLDIEPETALKTTNRKFRKRFRYIEDGLKAAGKTIDDSDLEEMDQLWNQAKSAA